MESLGRFWYYLKATQGPHCCVSNFRTTENSYRGRDIWREVHCLVAPILSISDPASHRDPASSLEDRIRFPGSFDAQDSLQLPTLKPTGIGATVVRVSTSHLLHSQTNHVYLELPAPQMILCMRAILCATRVMFSSWTLKFTTSPALTSHGSVALVGNSLVGSQLVGS